MPRSDGWCPVVLMMPVAMLAVGGVRGWSGWRDRPR
jgi:hypothetical protein